jgi:hypothetical protein
MSAYTLNKTIGEIVIGLLLFTCLVIALVGSVTYLAVTFLDSL